MIVFIELKEYCKFQIFFIYLPLFFLFYFYFFNQKKKR